MQIAGLYKATLWGIVGLAAGGKLGINSASRGAQCLAKMAPGFMVTALLFPRLQASCCKLLVRLLLPFSDGMYPCKLGPAFSQVHDNVLACFSSMACKTGLAAPNASKQSESNIDLCYIATVAMHPIYVAVPESVSAFDLICPELLSMWVWHRQAPKQAW